MSDKPSCLVVFYSRTGVTRKVAGLLAAALGAEIEEIRDAKDRSGFLGYLGAGKDAMFHRDAAIDAPAKNPADYDVILVGTPVWAFTMTPAVAAYLRQTADRLPRVAFFATQGGSGAGRAFRHMAELVDKQPVATLALMQKAVEADAVGDAVAAFVQQVRDGVGG